MKLITDRLPAASDANEYGDVMAYDRSGSNPIPWRAVDFTLHTGWRQISKGGRLQEMSEEWTVEKLTEEGRDDWTLYDAKGQPIFASAWEHKANAARDAHNAALSSLREDKARLDWLESRLRRPRTDGIEPFAYWLGGEYKRGPFREAIDAAMKESSELYSTPSVEKGNEKQ